MPATASVVSYDLEINGVPSRIVDTPGLADGKNLDDSYVDWIRRDVGEFGIDCLLFATPLHESRVRTDEIKAIETITNAFGSHIWRRSLVLLTFADFFPEAAQYKLRLERRPPGIAAAIAKATSDPAAAEAIPFIPLTNKDVLNPDGRRWLGRLQLALLDRMAPEGTSLFYGAGPDGGRSDARFRCYIRNNGGPPSYRFICRSAGTTGTCDFCRLPFEKTSGR
jgi:AIG1 family